MQWFGTSTTPTGSGYWGRINNRNHKIENLSQINYYSLRDRNIRKILTLRSLGQILEAKMPRYAAIKVLERTSVVWGCLKKKHHERYPRFSLMFHASKDLTNYGKNGTCIGVPIVPRPEKIQAVRITKRSFPTTINWLTLRLTENLVPHLRWRTFFPRLEAGALWF